MSEGKELTTLQKVVLGAAFVPMVATGVFGGMGTYSNIAGAYGSGTAAGAVAAGEGATAVLALVLLGLTMLGQSSPMVIRAGLWALPAAASVMATTAATDVGQSIIFALTPMGMTVAAEGMAFLARRIVVHQDGRDIEAEARAAAVVRELAYHRARAANHRDSRKRKASDRRSWKLARRVGVGDDALDSQLLHIQRERVTVGANAALGDMFTPATPVADQSTPHNTDETVDIQVDRSTPEQEKSAPEPTAVDPVAIPAALPPPLDPIKPLDKLPFTTTAARPTRPRGETGRVPKSARSPRPTRSEDELLAQARTATADWQAEELTADRIRKAVRTSAAKARTLRETLRAERSQTEQEVPA